MRFFSLFILLLIPIYALSTWKRASNQSWELCAELSKENSETITVGKGWYLTKGGMRNRDPDVCAFGQCKKLSLDVFVPLERRDEKSAKTVVGTFKCPLKSHNTSQYFFLSTFQRPQINAKKFRIVEWETSPNFIELFSWVHGSKFPMLNALVQAVWKGTTMGFDESFTAFYRLSGISHVLAVSGTHVVILYYLFNKGFSIFLFLFPFFLKARFVWMFRALLVFLAGYVLYKYSPGNAPVQRVLFYLITIALLNFKMWKASRVQIVSSGLALLLLYEPGFIISESFWLSAIGALFLSKCTVTSIPSTYFLSTLAIPVLMAPLIMLVFGQVSISAPLFGLFFSPLWDVVLIPIGYLAPLLALKKIGTFFFSYFEMFLQFIAKCQMLLFPLAERSQLVTLRLTIAEAFVLTICLVLLGNTALHFRRKNV